MGGCQSGQMKKTVNFPGQPYGGSNPPPPINVPVVKWSSHRPFKAESHGSTPARNVKASVAQLVEQRTLTRLNVVFAFYKQQPHGATIRKLVV